MVDFKFVLLKLYEASLMYCVSDIVDQFVYINHVIL